MRAILCLLAMLGAAVAQEPITVSSPGLAESSMTAEGALSEDWGAVRLLLDGEALASIKLARVQLDETFPAAQWTGSRGAIRLTSTAWRAPIWPAGVDVLTVRVENTGGQEANARLSLSLPETARIGPDAVQIGGRRIIALPDRALVAQEPREWGWWDSGSALAGWGKPTVPCDAAFANIRAGMGGVPLVYRFRTSQAQVALGILESHWAEPNQRPLVCAVEGAESRSVDPLTEWGRHRPGVLLFEGRDANADGWLDVVVTTPADAPDGNPILNAIWLFPPGASARAEDIAAGKLNALATRFVDVGGAGDQSLYPDANAAYDLHLAPGAADELTFLVACPRATAPDPEQSAWTLATLRRAAREVWVGR